MVPTNDLAQASIGLVLGLYIDHCKGYYILEILTHAVTGGVSAGWGTWYMCNEIVSEDHRKSTESRLELKSPNKSRLWDRASCSWIERHGCSKGICGAKAGQEWKRTGLGTKDCCQSPCPVMEPFRIISLLKPEHFSVSAFRVFLFATPKVLKRGSSRLFVTGERPGNQCSGSQS